MVLASPYPKEQVCKVSICPERYLIFLHCSTLTTMKSRIFSRFHWRKVHTLIQQTVVPLKLCASSMLSKGDLNVIQWISNEPWLLVSVMNQLLYCFTTSLAVSNKDWIEFVWCSWTRVSQRVGKSLFEETIWVYSFREIDWNTSDGNVRKF